ncbi:serine/threonine-protein kinase HT1 [Aspergillus tubingensis]|uniref:Serine/threonine-protein kinase HT1 n=1 Tax=Aspergillus niger TaxID=5061 RepID=A0A100IQA4_ASPNG|nr:serine/threonine-protein kinase HT1 [Aspergillus tubingensis]GAQ45404.1 serine/threonine-protein kinase HT1 [Aspergillus niger]GFN20423.1 serine/threonine-protein kinase HT1 [Aspergillus tubingensis]
MASSLFIDLDGNPLHDKEVLGYGKTGVVTCRDTVAVKIPLRHPWSSDEDVQTNVEVLEREQGIYHRLNHLPREQIDYIVPCLGLYKNATHLGYMENGDLRTYMTENRPSRALQITWFRQMAQALEQIHDKRVLVADVATRNFLLDSDLSIRFCDFSEASLLPIDTVMETADDDGFSIQTDIGQLGAVMYEVITRQKCDFDLFQEGVPLDGRASWPRRDSLPSTDGLWLGSIIEKCWVEGGFQNAHALSQALCSVDIAHTSLWSKLTSMSCWERQGRLRNSVVMLAVVVTAVAIAGSWTRRQPLTRDSIF